MSIVTRKIPGGNELLNPLLILEKAGLEQGMKIGDLGCGAKGYFALQAAKLVGRQGIVYGVDILKSVLKNLEEEAKAAGVYNIKLVWSNLEIFGATKIANEGLDFALIINLLFQVEKRSNVLKEAARMLKGSGKLLIIDWKKTGAPFGPPPNLRVSPEWIKNFALENGLNLEKEFAAGTYHFGLVFKKT